jgi:hypothetical protein
MSYQRAVLFMLFIPLILAGCLSKQSAWREQLNAQIDVYGVKLNSDVNYKEINGVVAVEEPCLRGYVRNFDDLDLTIGYGFGNRIRRITTRNAGTSIAGIRPGMAYGEGRQKALQAGFQEQASRFMFSANVYTLSLLVDGNNDIFGLTLEQLD